MKMAVFWVMRCVVWYKFTDVSEMLVPSIIGAIIIALIMEAGIFLLLLT
jgi:hypothetical protein